MRNRYFVQHIFEGRFPAAYVPTLQDAVEVAEKLWRDDCRQVIRDTETDVYWWRSLGEREWHGSRVGATEPDASTRDASFRSRWMKV